MEVSWVGIDYSGKNYYTQMLASALDLSIFAVYLQLMTNQRCMISSACPTLVRMEKLQNLDSKTGF